MNKEKTHFGDTFLGQGLGILAYTTGLGIVILCIALAFTLLKAYQ